MNVDKLEQTRKKPPPRNTLAARSRAVALTAAGEMDNLEAILNVNLEYAAAMDERVRTVVDELRMRGSVLILDPDKLEAQEEEASAERYNPDFSAPLPFAEESGSSRTS